MEDVNKRTIDLDWIDICWISLSRWVRLSSYSLDDSLFHKEKWLRHTTRKKLIFCLVEMSYSLYKKMKTVNKPVLKKDELLRVAGSPKNGSEYYFLRCLLGVTHTTCNSSATFSCWSWLKMYDISYKIARIFAQSNSIARAYLYSHWARWWRQLTNRPQFSMVYTLFCNN